MGPFFDDLVEHRSCQKMLRGRSEATKQLTYRRLMRGGARIPPMLQRLLNTFSGDARVLGAIGLKMLCWRDNQPQKRRFPGRD
jgi:hypothetical protein